MRNDYPDHPAGALDYHLDPNEVVTVRQSSMNAWIMIICGALMLAIGPMTMMTLSKVREERASEGRKTSRSPLAPLLLTLPFGVVMVGAGWWILKRSKPTVVVRPDGLEFPAQGLPPLRWDQIQQVDIATLVLIGAGGAQDYLGIKLRDGVLPDGPSPYSTVVMRAARAMAGWDFDVCISQNSVNINPCHLSMIMRIRLENARQRGENPPPPPGMEHLGGAIRPGTPGEAPKLAKPKTVPRAGLRMGCAAMMVLFGGCTALPGVMVASGHKFDLPKSRSGKKPIDMEDIENTMLNSMMFGAFLVIVGGVFVWPWPDDDDEDE